MGLPPQYVESIGIRPEGAPQTRGVEVADIGGAGQRVARSLLDTAEPKMADRAQEAALADAGNLALVKDADGNYVAPTPPKGGILYARAYNEAVDERFVTASMLDFETQANVKSGEYKNDPVGFLTTMRASAEARLGTAPPSVRGKLESLLNREILERHRGLADDMTRRTYANEVNGIEQMVVGKEAQAARLARLGHPDDARAIIQSIGADRVRLVKLGALGPEGSEGLAMQTAAKLGDDLDYGTATENLVSMAPFLAEGNATDEDLSRLSLWLDGVKTPGDINGLDYDKTRELFPSETVRNTFGSLVKGEISARATKRSEGIAAQRHAETIAATQAATAASDRIVTAIEHDFRDNNRNSTMGYSREQVAVIESKFGSIHDNMATPQGRNQTLGLISQYGHAPVQLIQYLDGSIDGDHMRDAVGFIESMRQMNVQGNNVGNQLYDQLAPKTRAVFEIYARGKQAGASDASIQGQVEAFRRGQQFSTGDSINLVNARGGEKDSDGKARGGYANQRAAILSKITGANPMTINVAKPVLAAFDEYLPIAMQIHGGNIDRAMEDAARSVSANFRPHRIFLDGFGPTALFSHGVAVGALSAALERRSNAQANPSGALLKQAANGMPRVRLQPLYNAPLTDGQGRQVLGRYRLVYFNAAGARAGEQIVDMDEVMADAIRINGRAAQAAKPPPPKLTGPRWQWRYDPVHKKNRFMLVQ